MVLSHNHCVITHHDPVFLVIQTHPPSQQGTAKCPNNYICSENIFVSRTKTEHFWLGRAHFSMMMVRPVLTQPTQLALPIRLQQTKHIVLAPMIRPSSLETMTRPTALDSLMRPSSLASLMRPSSLASRTRHLHFQMIEHSQFMLKMRENSSMKLSL